MIAIAHQAALAVEDTRYYSAMVQAERLAAVGQTIATLSHHIKNILQGIRGGSYLIKRGSPQHDETWWERAGRSSRRTRTRSPPWSWICSPSARSASRSCAAANLNTVVRDVRGTDANPCRREEGVELCYQLAEEMPELVFDPEGIHRAVLNILTNAIDAVAEMEPPGRVSLTTRLLREQNVAQVEIRETGPGIAADQMDKLFSPFVSTKKSRGTGLGLPVSQKILTEHGGKISIESLPGQGACFTLELPAVSPAAVTHVAEPPQA